MNEGLELIKEFEGCRLRAYRCPKKVLTIGYGHTKGVQEGQVITQAIADCLLEDDIIEAMENIKKLLKVKLNSNQAGAIVSFVFNLGGTAFAKSTLLKRINQSKFEEASKEFLKWNLCDGKISAGLVRRRQAESDLFNKSLAQS